jgi:hypothetical protein
MAMSTVMEWIPYLSARCQGRMGSYCYALSWLVLKTEHVEAPSMWRPRFPFWVVGLGVLLIESRLPMLNCRVVE